MANVPDFLSATPSTRTSDNIATALSSPPRSNASQNTASNNAPSETQRSWTSNFVGNMSGFVSSARDLASSSSLATNAATSLSSTATSLSSNLSSSMGGSMPSVNLQPFHSFTKSLSHNLSGKSTLPDKTTASQVLMFRQLLHTKCRPGLRLSRGYEGTAAQRAVLHMPWWERGIEQSKKMVISYDNLITRLWLSGAIMPYEKGGYASIDNVASPGASGSIDTLINEKGLPPVPHEFWVERLGFQQDDPVTDFRSGGVLSLAMLVHIVESCPAVHARFVPKHPGTNGAAHYAPSNDPEMSLDQIITEDASVLPFGITCINVTDMLAKFLMFSKSVDKMDALLSAKPFWRMFIDPNAMLILQEVSLDLLCDVCVEIGRERRLARLTDSVSKKDDKSMLKMDGKVTVFDFSEIMDRTEKRVGDEVLGAGPQNVEELRAIARRVKSKYLMRLQLKEKHLVKKSSPQKSLSLLPSKESTMTTNVTNAVMGGVGGLTSMWKSNPAAVDKVQNNANKPVIPSIDESETAEEGEVEIQYVDANTTQTQPQQTEVNKTENVDVLAESFDLLGGDFSTITAGDIDQTDQELLDTMDVKVDAAAAFTIDDDDFRI